MQPILDELASALCTEHRHEARWSLFTTGLAKLGLDQINYAFLDLANAHRMDARGDPAMSTMRDDWISHYAEQKYDLRDSAVAHIRAGNALPIIWSKHLAKDADAPEIIYEANDAGLTSGMLVPLAGLGASAPPSAGVMLGSSQREEDLRMIVAEHGLELLTLAHLFHAGSVGELIRQRHGVPPLSARERDCIQYLARGLRPDAIADRLRLSRVTIDLHIRNARRKLRARTGAECVARAVLYQMISIG